MAQGEGQRGKHIYKYPPTLKWSSTLKMYSSITVMHCHQIISHFSTHRPWSFQPTARSSSNKTAHVNPCNNVSASSSIHFIPDSTSRASLATKCFSFLNIYLSQSKWNIQTEGIETPVSITRLEKEISSSVSQDWPEGYQDKKGMKMKKSKHIIFLFSD
jgi:hypothetical protein